MISTIIPKFIFDEDDITYLVSDGIQIVEGMVTINKYKIPCYKFSNLTENELFNHLESHQINEANNTEAQKSSYANRAVSILFLRIRQVANMKDKDQKVAAACALLGAVNSLANINITYANRFLPLLRSLV